MKEIKPRCHYTALIRMTEAANGPTLWSHVTPHSFDACTDPEYFAPQRQGLRPFDRILLVCNAKSAPPETPDHDRATAQAALDAQAQHATLTVTGVTNTRVNVAILRELPPDHLAETAVPLPVKEEAPSLLAQMAATDEQEAAEAPDEHKGLIIRKEDEQHVVVEPGGKTIYKSPNQAEAEMFARSYGEQLAP